MTKREWVQRVWKDAMYLYHKDAGDSEIHVVLAQWYDWARTECPNPTLACQDEQHGGCGLAECVCECHQSNGGTCA